MKHLKFIGLGFLFLITLASCSGDEKRTKPLIDDVVTTSIPESSEQTKETTSYDLSNDELIKKYSSNKKLMLALCENISKVDRFSYKYEGKTVAHTIISYTQDIFSETERNKDKGYFNTKSSSVFVNTSLKGIFTTEEASYKYNSDEVTKSTLKEFETKFGITPFTSNILGYNVNDETLQEVTIKGYKTNLYDFSMTLSVDAVSKELLTEMKEFGSLGDYPKFKKIELEILFDNNLKPLKMLLFTEYTIDYGILSNTSCTQEITVTYEHFDEDFNIKTEI